MATDSVTEWEELGQRLDLMVHLADARRGLLGEATKYNDHSRLRSYGYAMNGCICGVDSPPLQLRVWRANTP